LYYGLAIINWSFNTLDFETTDADVLYTNIINEIKDGDIVLCHDNYESTATAMSRIIPELIEAGCQLVTVSELLLHKYGEIEPGKLYNN